MRATSSSGRDFRTLDPWDIALEQCEPDPDADPKERNRRKALTVYTPSPSMG